jgi:hypothetical protein
MDFTITWGTDFQVIDSSALGNFLALLWKGHVVYHIIDLDVIKRSTLGV